MFCCLLLSTLFTPSTSYITTLSTYLLLLLLHLPLYFLSRTRPFIILCTVPLFISAKKRTIELYTIAGPNIYKQVTNCLVNTVKLWKRGQENCVNSRKIGRKLLYCDILSKLNVHTIIRRLYFRQCNFYISNDN